jgi:hypothetical protein
LGMGVEQARAEDDEKEMKTWSSDAKEMMMFCTVVLSELGF